MSNHERILRSHGATFDGGTDASRLAIAKEWEENFPDVREMDKWCEAGCWDADTASELNLAGFRPGIDELEYVDNDCCVGYARNMTPMYALCNNDVSLENLTW